MRKFLLILSAFVGLTLSAKTNQVPHQKADCGSIDRLYIYSEEMGGQRIFPVGRG